MSVSGLKSSRKSSAALGVRPFGCQRDWARWLKENHGKSPGVWLQLAKKGTSMESVSYEESVETALCFGWIDGQKKAHSEQYWLQKFTPRCDKSLWSKINKAKALALIKAGKMKAAGLKEIERAKRDGRWDAAYDSASKSVVPGDFQSMLDSNARAKEFFGTLDSRNRYAVVFRIQTAKLTELGRAVLRCKVDWMSLQPAARWVGGVHVGVRTPGWRWDEATREAVQV